MLNQAEEASQKGEFDKARSLTEAAIESCRQIINYKGEKSPEIEKPKKVSRFRISVPLIVILILLIAAVLIYLSRHVRFRRGRSASGAKPKPQRSRVIGPRVSEDEISKMFKERKL